MDDRKFFDIHVESPAWDITKKRYVSVMINVRGNQPDPLPKLVEERHGRINPTPIYEKLSDIPFDVESVVYLETTNFSEIKMHDCVWIHYFDKRDITGDIQIVPNRLKYSKPLSEPDSLLESFLRWIF
jgi:hypothetical protein